MTNSKELSQYIMEQLSDLGDVRNIPMMGGYIFYYKERTFGGIYGNGFMVKITEARNTCRTVLQNCRMTAQNRCCRSRFWMTGRSCRI